MRRVVCALAVLTGLLAPLCAQADEGETTSSFSVVPENDGLTFHFVNRSYDWTSIWDPDSGEAKHLLLMETEDRTVSNAVDGTLHSAVTVEVSQVGLDGKVEPLYTISDPGEVGEIRWIAFDQAYYQTTTYGCCGAFNSSRTYSLRSGQKLFSHTVPPAWFEVPNAGGLVRLVGVHTIYSMDDFEVFGERTDALALVTLATPTEPVEAFLIAVDGTLSSEELEYPDASVGWSEPGEPPAPELTVWTADGERDITKVEGLKLVIGFPPELRIEVPLVAGHLDIANAVVPKGLRLEPQPVEVP